MYDSCKLAKLFVPVVKMDYMIKVGVAGRGYSLLNRSIDL